MRSKLVLLLALVMGIITTFLFFKYMQQFNAEKVSTTHTVSVVVAKEEIQNNEKITADKLEVVNIPEKNVLPENIKTTEQAVGKTATSMIAKGEPILTHRLVSEKEETIYVSRKVREDYRAVSVGANFNQSVSNLMEPEDEVDVIYSKGNKLQGTVVSVILLEKARVLAVGRKILTPDDKKEPYAEYSSVTLELKPQDALKLVNASEQGNIHFILHKRPVIKEDNASSHNH